MKKRFLFSLVIIMCFILVGCGNNKNNWQNHFQLSTLKLEKNYIIGKIKNLDDKAYDLTIRIKLKSGTLTDSGVCYETLKPNETKELECLAYNIDDSYSFEISNISFEEIEIPQLKNGEITIDSLEYHFEEIYELHTLSFVSFATTSSDNNYPYIDKVNYDGTNIKIEGTVKLDNESISYYETYNTSTNELDDLSIFFTNIDSSFQSKLATKVSLMRSLGINSYNSLDVGKALMSTDIEDGYCIKVEDWCISNKFDSSDSLVRLNAYFIHRR